eukprot:TRINITY_DN9380_c0_g1_i1.p1 TRINITY_DN9380_c0_g1~~TRINITY_DN9380_c0_g1_i1.p1  ORF type:complete len:389 (+),score=2.19 TRINITY_DN9380_c0_g1_i1:76-1242(+)
MAEQYHHISLLHLPEDILSLIFSFLDQKTVIGLPTVCKSLCTTLRSETLWKSIFCSNYPLSRLQPRQGRWKSLFLLKYQLEHNIEHTASKNLTFRGQFGWIRSIDVAYSANGELLLSGSNDGSIAVWNLTNPDKGDQHVPFEGGSVSAVRCAGFGKCLATTNDGRLCQLDLDSGQVTKQSKLSSFAFNGLDCGKSLFATSTREQTDVMDLQTWQVVQQFYPSEQRPMRRVRFVEGTNDQILIAGHGNDLALYDMRVGTATGLFKGLGAAIIEAIDVSGNIMVSAVDQRALVWDLRTQRLAHVLNPSLAFPRMVYSVCISGDMIAASSGASFYLYRYRGGQPSLTIEVTDDKDDTILSMWMDESRLIAGGMARSATLHDWSRPQFSFDE